IAAHGVAFEFPPPRLEDAVARLRSGEEPDVLVREISSQISREAELRLRMETAAALAALREQARALSRLLETTRISFTLLDEGPFALAVTQRDALEQILSSEERRRAAAQAVRDAARKAPSELRQR